MSEEQSLQERLRLLIRAFQRQKLLWFPMGIALPFAFVWRPLFLRLMLSAVLLPVALFLHELLHMLFIPKRFTVSIISRPTILALELEGQMSPFRAFLAALAPHVAMWGMAAWLWDKDGLLALPFILSGLSLPLDLYTWYRRAFYG